MEAEFKALSEIVRLDLFLIISKSPEICLCDLEKFFTLSMSNISRHLKELESANLITFYKKGKWKYYLISDRGKVFVNFINSNMNEKMQSRLKGYFD
jgi:DNA-binding transcriptional ArsR family regulator